MVSMIRLTMFSGSIPALVTPFSQDGSSIDYDAFQNLLFFHLEKGSDAVVIGGTTGEAPTLSQDEIRRLTSISTEIIAGKIPVIVGTGSSGTEKSVEMTQEAKELGADGALVTIPYYNLPTERGITEHFKAIAEVELPIIVYHHPVRTGITLSADHLLELNQLEHVVGIKEASSTPGLAIELLEREPTLSLFCGDDALLLEMLIAGATGSISIMANIVPKEWKKIIQLSLDENDIASEDLYEDLRTLMWATFLEVNPQGIKCALSLARGISNSLRLPLVPVSVKTHEEINAALEKLSLISHQ